MAYIGNIPAEKYQTLQKQSFTTSATDTYTLSYSVTNPQDLALFINNVRQNPNNAYTVSGTTLTLSSAITSSDTMYAVFLGRAVETIAPATGSVTNDMLAGSIANSKLANSSITLNGSAVSLGGSATIGGGKINQVVTATNTNSTSSSSTSFVETVNTVAITPSATDSKIFVVTHFGVKNPQHNQAYFTLYRDISGGSATNLGDSTYGLVGSKYAGGEAKEVYGMSFLDSPSTTSTTEYKVFVKSANSSTVKMNPDSKWSITAMEVLA